MRNTLLVGAAIAVTMAFASTAAFAEDRQVSGTATLPIPKSAPGSVRTPALLAAKRRAVLNAINLVLGADATDSPDINRKIDEILEQITDAQIIASTGTVVDGQFKQSVTLSIDDKSFRALLSDKGIAVNTAAVRSSAILAMMDEYVTTEKDLHAPLMDLTEFSSRKGASMSDQSKSGSFAKSSNYQASKEASAAYAAGATADRNSASHDDRLSGSASGSQSGQFSGGNSSGDHAAGSFSNSAQGHLDAQSRGSNSSQSASSAVMGGGSSSSSASAETSSSGAMSRTNVKAEVHDDVNYKHLVVYQPQSKAPESLNRTYAALVGELNDYDIRIKDNDQFRSKYFGKKSITIDQIVNGDELAKYVSFAKSEAQADFLMVGASVIVDSGVNASTGQRTCTGVVTLKTYSTIDGENIASETVSESGAGQTMDQCAGNIAKKMAAVGGQSVGRRIQEYWKRRTMYGQDYVLTLAGSNLTLMLKTNFSRALASVPGVTSVGRPRVNDDRRYEVTVTYRGSDPIDQAAATVLSSNPSFSTLDSVSEGGKVTLCMGPCSAVLKR